MRPEHQSILCQINNVPFSELNDYPFPFLYVHDEIIDVYAHSLECTKSARVISPDLDGIQALMCLCDYMREKADGYVLTRGLVTCYDTESVNYDFCCPTQKCKCYHRYCAHIFEPDMPESCCTNFVVPCDRKDHFYEFTKESRTHTLIAGSEAVSAFVKFLYHLKNFYSFNVFIAPVLSSQFESRWNVVGGISNTLFSLPSYLSSLHAFTSLCVKLQSVYLNKEEFLTTIFRLSVSDLPDDILSFVYTSVSSLVDDSSFAAIAVLPSWVHHDRNSSLVHSVSANGNARKGFVTTVYPYFDGNPAYFSANKSFCVGSVDVIRKPYGKLFSICTKYHTSVQQSNTPHVRAALLTLRTLLEDQKVSCIIMPCIEQGLNNKFGLHSIESILSLLRNTLFSSQRFILMCSSAAQSIVLPRNVDFPLSPSILAARIISALRFRDCEDLVLLAIGLSPSPLSNHPYPVPLRGFPLGRRDYALFSLHYQDDLLEIDPTIRLPEYEAYTRISLLMKSIMDYIGSMSTVSGFSIIVQSRHVEPPLCLSTPSFVHYCEDDSFEIVFLPYVFVMAQKLFSRPIISRCFSKGFFVRVSDVRAE